MSRIELARSSKGLIQRVEGMFRATLPRQARVTAVEGNSVWVRFLGEESSDPEAKFVSTVAGVPVATMGWVITLGGKKGLFVVTGIPKPVHDRTGEAHSVTATTSGYYWATSAAVTITGLNPAREYVVSGTGGIRTTGTTARRFVVLFEAAGATTVRGGSLTTMASRDQEVTHGIGVAKLKPNEDGEITLTPGFQWVSGTVAMNYAELLYTVS